MCKQEEEEEEEEASVAIRFDSIRFQIEEETKTFDHLGCLFLLRDKTLHVCMCMSVRLVLASLGEVRGDTVITSHHPYVFGWLGLILGCLLVLAWLCLCRGGGCCCYPFFKI